MNKLANFIVDKRRLFMIIFAVLLVVCAVLALRVEVNHDMSEYLPADSDTIKGLGIMETEFGAPGSMSVMVKDISLNDATELREELEDVEGVDSVMFLDTLLLGMKTDAEQTDKEYIDGMFDMLNMVYKMQADYFPDRSLGYVYDKMMGFMSSMSNTGGGMSSMPSLPNIPGFETDQGTISGGETNTMFAVFGDGGQSMANIDGSSLDMLEGYYKKNCALISVTMKNGDFDTRTYDAVAEISRIAPKYGESYYTGQSASAYYNNKDSGDEMMVIGLVAVAIILLILFLTTHSWIEPLLYFGVILVAVILNMGTNIFIGAVSSMTNTIAALLQLALSIDYSIFLLHAYNAEKKKTPDKVQAMKNALKKSLSPISASSLTTIASFVALMFMTFQIGMNFGLVLGKGIVFSLISVFLLMPVFVLGLDKALVKTEHRSLPEFLKDRKRQKQERKAAFAHFGQIAQTAQETHIE